MDSTAITKNRFLVPKQHVYTIIQSYNCVIYYVWKKSDRPRFLEKISSGQIWIIFTIGQFWDLKACLLFLQTRSKGLFEFLQIFFFLKISCKWDIFIPVGPKTSHASCFRNPH